MKRIFLSITLVEKIKIFFYGTSLVLSDEFFSADYESEVKNVLSREFSDTNGVLWAKNHNFNYFHDIVIKRVKVRMYFCVYRRIVHSSYFSSS